MKKNFTVIKCDTTVAKSVYFAEFFGFDFQTIDNAECIACVALHAVRNPFSDTLRSCHSHPPRFVYCTLRYHLVCITSRKISCSTKIF